MLVVLTIFSAGLLGVIIFFAVSSRSSRLLKLSALIALGIIALSLAVCGFILIMGRPSQEAVNIPFPILPDTPKQAPVKRANANLVEIIVLIVLFLFVLGLLVFSARKEFGKKAGTAKKPNSTIFADEDQLKIERTDIEDSFKIDEK